MLNAIFVLLVVGAVVTAAFTGRMPQVMDASIESAKTAVSIAIDLLALKNDTLPRFRPKMQFIF